MAARYNNAYDSRSSIASSTSSSTELKRNKNGSFSSSSRAIVKSKASDLSRTNTTQKCDKGNLTSMVKKFMEMKANSSKSKRVELVIPSDVIAEELKKPGVKGVKGGNSGFGALQRKLFGKPEKEKKEKTKALTEVKGNTRTLAMVLRSERELLGMNKEQEMEIAELKLQLGEKNKEVEKLKDLCLKQREEIKALKSAVLFPDVMNCQLQELLEEQGSELKQARQIIPSLQRQVTSLTGQLQCLAEDLAEVKADKYSSRACFQRQSNSQERTSLYDHGDSSDSLDFSSSDPVTPGSPDDLLLEDLNPCLTPYSKTKSKESSAMDYDSLQDSFSANSTLTIDDELAFSSTNKKLSKSSDCCQGSKVSKQLSRPARRSEESKAKFRKPMSQKRF